MTKQNQRKKNNRTAKFQQRYLHNRKVEAAKSCKSDTRLDVERGNFLVLSVMNCPASCKDKL